MEGAPDELAGLTNTVTDSILRHYATRDTAVEKEALGDDIGCVQAADAKGDNIVESS